MNMLNIFALFFSALSNIACFYLGYYICSKSTKIITIDKAGNVINHDYNDELEPAIYITPELELEYEQRLKKRVDENE